MAHRFGIKPTRLKIRKLNGSYLEQWLEIYAIKRCAVVVANDVGQKLLLQPSTADLIEMLRSTPIVLFLTILR